ncbi:ABC transporter related [Acidimicrobium ferrooxidans DSM 10331]|uniref:ABC transporter related n=1 Tax=Acidimicrobium ferrooxidans (strain DSM 10331 / JCM 15462 / NBRC 103882 / ICP) TaxID=525909 RepID=C7LZT2_ACIFD|nr:ABC transporter ATP-binding protein [Acidimicrobium ferrooxidans]ACU54240.1 ABC transporter related [Acidimicrobium ferrooxidans DSM 10331]
MTEGQIRDMEPLYELRGVRKSFRRHGAVVNALDGVDLVIERGEFVAIQGPTGQGKTTLLTLLGALDRPDAGELRFEGRDLAHLGEAELAELRATALGFVFQTFNLIPTLTAQENVETALVPLHVETEERHKRAARVLEELGLADRAQHLPTELSGGQQQRVAIARALVKDPEVLLADEPTGNLDEQTRDDIVALLEGLWRDRGITLIVVTHDSTVAGRARRRLVIDHGTVAERADGQRGPSGEPTTAG